MTNREFYQAVINANMNAELTEFATAAIAKLDKRKETPSKASREFAGLVNRIGEQLNRDTVYTATMVGEQFEISTQKASAVLKALTKNDKMTVADVKKEKGRSVKGYTLI